MWALERLACRAQGGSALQRAVLWFLFWPLLLALICQLPSGVEKHRRARPGVGRSNQRGEASAGLQQFS